MLVNPGQDIVVYHGVIARTTTSDVPFDCPCDECAEDQDDRPPFPVYRLENLKTG